MSFRYPFAIVKPGFNALASQTTTYTYGIWSWGQNNVGQLGLGVATYGVSSPTQIGALTTWSALGGTKAIKTDGTLWSWGRNNFGQVGDGTIVDKSSPIQIGTLTNWIDVTTGYATFAIKTDGTLWTWGYNANGCLGTGNTTNYSSPKQVGALTNWSYAINKTTCSAAIKTDGTLWTWGQNQFGQLGLNNKTYYSSPKQVGADTNWYKTACGWYHMVAIKTDGTLWTWGLNSSGQLGLNIAGVYTSRSSPTQVGALTNWSNIACGGNFIIAAKTDGTLWVWGQNQYGQLGLGNTTYYSSPKQVGSLTNWGTSMGGAYYASSVVKTNGTLWTWGYNSYGELGLGNQTYYSSPKQVGALTNWGKVYSISGSTFALQI